MRTIKILDSFIKDRKFEEDLNMKSLYYPYTFPEDIVSNYVSEINCMEIQSILDYINGLSDLFISVRDVFQFSNIDNATYRLCEKLKVNNPGLTFIEGGRLLLDDGKERKDTAYIKYGENHLKTACDLGLVFELTGEYFLSCLGFIINDLNDIEKEKLLVRLVLRTKLIERLYKAAKNGEVNMRQFLYMISDSTYVRRKVSIKTILNILRNSKEYDFSEFLNKITF